MGPQEQRKEEVEDPGKDPKGAGQFPHPGNSSTQRIWISMRQDKSGGSARCREQSRKYGIYGPLLVAFITVIAMLIYNAQTPACNCPSCPNKWTKYNETCYFASKRAAVWMESQTYCVTEGGMLLILNDTVWQQIEELFPLYQDHWIGLTKDPGTQKWTWVNGAAHTDLVKYDDDPRMNCAYINRDIGALDCSSARPWICIKSI